MRWPWRETERPKPPSWLELEPGEELLATYQGRQIAEVIVYVVLAILMLCCLVTLILLAVGEVKKDAAGILTSVGGTITGIGVTLGQIKKTQLHVTSRMLIFAQGKKAAGVPLSEVVAIERGDGSRWTIGIYLRGNPKAVGITVRFVGNI